MREELPLSPLEKKKKICCLYSGLWTFDEGPRPGLALGKPGHSSHFQYCQDWVLYDNECGEKEKKVEENLYVRDFTVCKILNMGSSLQKKKYFPRSEEFDVYEQ